MRPDFKPFTPKIDKVRRLVLTRFYCGMNGGDLFMYQIHKINSDNMVDKFFTHLYALGTHQMDSVGSYHHAKTGEPVEVFKMDFQHVCGCDGLQNVEKIWKIGTQ